SLLLLLGLLGALLAVALEELDEALKGSVSGVVDDLVGAGGEELDGREGLDLDVLDLQCGGVHLGDDDALVVGVLLSQLLPGGNELLAVSAPGSVELDEDVLGGVTGDLLEVLSDESLHGALVPVLGDVLGHEMGLEVALEVS
ncbi:hypothetical protein PMAYCL1PPCAC_30865, partial [Pristionchus mayeri]